MLDDDRFSLFQAHFDGFADSILRTWSNQNVVFVPVWGRVHFLLKISHPIQQWWVPVSDRTNVNTAICFVG